VQSIKFTLALGLLLATQTAATADSGAVLFRGPDHVYEFASDDTRPNPGGYNVASFKSADDPAMFTAIAVTVFLTTQGS